MATVGIGGLGSIGLPVAKRLLAGGIPGLKLKAVSARNVPVASAKLAAIGGAEIPIVAPVDLASCDIVVECAAPAAFEDISWPAIRAGRTLVALTATRLLANLTDMKLAAEESGARIVVPTGALCGLDAVRAVAEGGQVEQVLMRTSKPPSGLQQAPFVLEQGLDLSRLEEPLQLYHGTVTEAAQKFPANVNVAVALSLAGVGPDLTQYEIYADPNVTRNTHTIHVIAKESSFTINIAGVPSENPATGMLTPLSTIATLRGLVSSFKVGT